jgi:hypothetical protein
MPGTECSGYGEWCDVGETANWAISPEDHFVTRSIPPELGSLTTLRFLHLNDNKLTGPNPSELGYLPIFSGCSSMKGCWGAPRSPPNDSIGLVRRTASA